jgi:hypothetical protein
MLHRTHIPKHPFYILKDGKPVPAEDDERAFEDFVLDLDSRRVANTLLYAPNGARIHICTDFICHDENWPNDGPPVLWETQITWPGNDKLHYWIKRYTSVEAARSGHEKAVALVEATISHKQ